MRLRRADVSRFDVVKTAYSPPDSTEDALAIIDVSGFGLPNFGRWFWTSRSVYMQMEPAWLSVFSGGVLGPKLVYINARITPGCVGGQCTGCPLCARCCEDSEAVQSATWDGVLIQYNGCCTTACLCIDCCPQARQIGATESASNHVDDLLECAQQTI
jgi:hypothetical protein